MPTYHTPEVGPDRIFTFSAAGDAEGRRNRAAARAAFRRIWFIRNSFVV